MSSAVSKSLIHCDTSDGPLDKAGRAWLKSLLKEWVGKKRTRLALLPRALFLTRPRKNVHET
jgi:hypothetical protein